MRTTSEHTSKNEDEDEDELPIHLSRGPAVATILDVDVLAIRHRAEPLPHLHVVRLEGQPSHLDHVFVAPCPRPRPREGRLGAPVAAGAPIATAPGPIATAVATVTAPATTVATAEATVTLATVSATFSVAWKLELSGIKLPSFINSGRLPL